VGTPWVCSGGGKNSGGGKKKSRLSDLLFSHDLASAGLGCYKVVWHDLDGFGAEFRDFVGQHNDFLGLFVPYTAYLVVIALDGMEVEILRQQVKQAARNAIVYEATTNTDLGSFVGGFLNPSVKANIVIPLPIGVISGFGVAVRRVQKEEVVGLDGEFLEVAGYPRDHWHSLGTTKPGRWQTSGKLGAMKPKECRFG